jgi:hypothetical protein
MSAKPVVESFKITRQVINSKDVPELSELFNLNALPLGPSNVEIELKNVPTAVVNGLRRVITDELPGYALSVPVDGFDNEQTTEVYMLPQFVIQRLGLVALRPQIDYNTITNLRLKLDVSNTSTAVRAVYSGDLEEPVGCKIITEPLFNPTTKLCTLQPGKRIVINNIQLSSGMGRNDAKHNVACHASFYHRDVEQYADDEIRAKNGIAAEQSGYKVSSLVSDPRHHVLMACLPATTARLSEVRATFADACSVIMGRLRLIGTTVERKSDTPSGGFAHRGVQYTVVDLEDGLTEGVVRVPNETYTIGEIMRRTIFDLTPDIVNISLIVESHNNVMILTVRHTSDVTSIIMAAVDHAISTFDAIQIGITDAK